ncbi:Uncharacterised protein [Serratia quinivorans]|nr:Uncharacterised protein [Serratia quinivorans]CAI1036583.1 Uncharacterised protein [Serratia quinivorans]CAI1874307.1 Uncharacterised protein [Serratia quinivorans]CAI2113958.1 Uncharacterised protein [Serratia quinivorans]CAI2147177.1 Uncharacterised protein [Serratia quinivorans]
MNKDNNGFNYRHETELTINSTPWEHGQVDCVSVSGPHQVQLVRPGHTLIVYDIFSPLKGGTPLRVTFGLIKNASPANGR